MSVGGWVVAIWNEFCLQVILEAFVPSWWLLQEDKNKNNCQGEVSLEDSIFLSFFDGQGCRATFDYFFLRFGQK